jgi:hypothetical protein
MLHILVQQIQTTKSGISWQYVVIITVSIVFIPYVVLFGALLHPSRKRHEKLIENPHAKKTNRIFADLCTLLSSPMLCHVGLDVYEGVSWGGRPCVEWRPALFPFQCARIVCVSVPKIGILWPKMSEILCAAHSAVALSFNDQSSQNIPVLIACAFNLSEESSWCRIVSRSRYDRTSSAADRRK